MIKFRIFSINIFLSFWAILLLSFGVISSASGQTDIIICLFCVIAHEIGHIVMISVFCGKPDKILINLFEMKIYSDLSRVSTFQEILITSIGVIVNFTMSLICYALSLAFDFELIHKLFVYSSGIGLINILPVYSLDGGQLLRLLLTRFFSEKTTDIITLVFSILILIPVAFICVFVLFLSKNNFSLLFIAMYIFSVYFKRNCGDLIV